tara:strand:+ start:112 stop:639 length:528 start_codon:yes stop_codon:yes gene_type:complete
MIVKSYIVEKEEMVSTWTKEFSDFFNFMVSCVSLWVYVTIVPDNERREREYKYFYNAIVKDDLEERKKSAGEDWKVTWSRGHECFEYELIVNCLDSGAKKQYMMDGAHPDEEELHQVRVDRDYNQRPYLCEKECEELKRQLQEKAQAFVPIVVEGTPIKNEGVVASAPTLQAIIS